MMHHTRKGFSLIEILVSVGILSIAVLTAVPFGRSFIQKRTVETYQKDIEQALRTAQGKAVAGDQGQPWGVKFSSNDFTVFAGTNYASAVFRGAVRPVQAPYSLSWTLPGGADEVTFSPLRGVPPGGGSIRVSHPDGLSKDVAINGAGLVYDPNSSGAPPTFSSAGSSAGASSAASSAAASSVASSAAASSVASSAAASSVLSSAAASSSVGGGGTTGGGGGTFNPSDPIPNFPQAPIATVNVAPCTWNTWEQLKLDAFVVRAGIAYVACSTTALPFTTPGRFFIVDTNQNPPVILNTLALPYVPTDMKLDGDRAYLLGGVTGPNVFTTGVVDIINIQNPATAASLGSLTYANPGFPHNMVVEGSSIYVADGASGEKIYLFTLNAAKTSLTPMGTFTLNASSNRFAQYLNIAMTPTHLYVVRAFNSPALVIYRRDGPLQFTAVYDSQASGAQPSIASWNAQDVQVNNGIIYAPSPSGLNTVSGTIPILSRATAAYPTSMTFPTAFIHGRYLYLTSVDIGKPVRIFDLQNPAAPQLLSQSIPMVQQRARLPYAEGKYLYIVRDASIGGPLSVAIYDLQP